MRLAHAVGWVEDPGRGSRRDSPGRSVRCRQSIQHDFPRRSLQPSCRGSTPGKPDFAASPVPGRSDRGRGWHRSSQPCDRATDWSRPPSPRTSAPRVDAASAGASITTLPLRSRRTWSWEKSSRTSPADGSAATAAVVVLSSSKRWGVPRSNGATAGPAGSAPAAVVAIRGGSGGLVPRFVGRLDQLVERIGDLVVEAGVGEVGVLVGLVAGRCDGLERRRFVELLDLRQEVR